MHTYTGIQQLQHNGPTVLTIGNFDGVHRGHQALLATAVETAQGMDHARTALVTFQPHPLAVLRPEVSLHLLTTPMERLQIAAGVGIATLKRMEQGSGPIGGSARSAWKIEQALQAAGVELLPPTQAHGLGVRLTKPE